MTTPGPILPCNSAAGPEGDPAMRTITMASEVKERPGNYQDRSGCARDFGSQGVTPRLNTDRARLEMLIAGRAPTLGR